MSEKTLAQVYVDAYKVKEEIVASHQRKDHIAHCAALDAVAAHAIAKDAELRGRLVEALREAHDEAVEGRIVCRITRDRWVRLINKVLALAAEREKL